MKQLISYTPAIALTILIPLLSLINPNRLPDTSALHFAGLDKVIHMLMYAVLTTAWVFALPVKARTSIRWMLSVAFLSAMYGVLLEICQFLFTTSRSMDMLDAVANLAGALLAAATIYWISGLKSSPVEKEESNSVAEHPETKK